MLLGCAGLKEKLASFQPGDAGGSNPVNMSTVCLAFLQPVNVPIWLNEKTDARVASDVLADAYLETNRRIVDGRDCFSDQLHLYAGKKPGAAVVAAQTAPAAAVKVAAKAKPTAKLARGKKGKRK